ncbi:hypothetical protein NLJ89_g9113 [Agrocybe chaxingu]|uniref:Macro domain-like protein n=1 Tax=Agrocybe chaxingu TaxID=84603 RepID=A0A9W8MTF7_9AGAR|nr:hypothetical protein NLJ89_g9113 [Agrocybe chaxingu]
MGLPKFILLDMSGPLVRAWEKAFKEHNLIARENFEFVNSLLHKLPEDKKQFDCIVSPANSYGRLDGSFDWYISETLAPPDDFAAVTRITQQVLYARWKGFAPPGTCTLIPLKDTTCFPNKHSCRFIALCPTMRIPESVTWDREIVYNCVWALLNEITAHNDRVSAAASGQEGEDSDTIQTVLMSGLATGVGNVSAEKCAKQTALAFKDFYDALEHPDKWSTLEWGTAIEIAKARDKTHAL